MNLTEIRSRLAEIQPEIVELGTAETLTPEQSERFSALETEWDTLSAEAAPLEARAARIDAVRSTVIARTTTTERSIEAPNVHIRQDPFEVLESRGRGMSEGQHRQALVDANLRAIESKIEDGDNQAHFERVLRRHTMSQKHDDIRWSENLLGRSHPDYQSAWQKLMTGREAYLTNEERTAMSVGSNTNGGYLVPTHLDPTIILTNAGSDNVVRQLARKVTLTEGNVWHGVSSAGVTASYDAELAEVSDDTPTFGSPSVDLETARAFAQASIEAFQDVAGLATDILMLFADARDNLEGVKFAVGAGSGSNEPRGIYTALDANTNVELTSTTAAAIGVVDLNALFLAVPLRFRKRAAWLMNPKWSLGIKDLGTAVSASFSGDLREGTAGTLLGKPLYESDDAPTTATTTALDNRIILGDFSNYVVVDKPGSLSVEFIPHLFNTSANLPDGRRGWFCHWRSGGNSVNDLAFRLLQDKTSA